MGFIYKCKIRGIIKEIPKKLCLEYGKITHVISDIDWPKGTIMAKEVMLIGDRLY